MPSTSGLIALFASALLLAGCAAKANKPAAGATPPTPSATAAARTQPRPEPLSIPQTQVRLPAPQPVPPEALATAEPVVVELPDPPALKGTPRANPPRIVTAPPPRTEARSEPAAAAPPAEPERPLVVEKISPQEQKRLTDSLAARRREIMAALEQAAARGPNQDEKDTMNRIRSFVDLADKAAARGDLQQADALAERAQVLARELQRGR